jgi:hypothetical protein
MNEGSPSLKTCSILSRITRPPLDSTSEQFWGSEQYIRNIPLRRSHSKDTHRDPPIFTRCQLEAFEKEARILNMKGQGDQACFYVCRE